MDHPIGTCKTSPFVRRARERAVTKSTQLGNVIGYGLVHVQLHYGLGRPQYYLTEWHLIEIRKYAYGEWIQTFATLMWTKVSICLFLRRIPVTKVLIRPLEISVVFLLVSNVIITILWIVQCRPVDAAWNSYLQGSCFSRGQLERIVIAQASESNSRCLVMLLYDD